MVPPIAFESGVLDKTKHGRLVLDIDQYAKRAGIAPECIWTSAKDNLSPQEVKYLQKCLMLAHQDTPGLVYSGDGDVSWRFCLMVGALIRAFVDARSMTAMEVVDQITHGDHPEATVLFVPNFFSAVEFGKFDMRRASALGDMLVYRAAHHLPTVIKVDSLSGVSDRFGSHVGGIIKKMVHQGV